MNALARGSSTVRRIVLPNDPTWEEALAAAFLNETDARPPCLPPEKLDFTFEPRRRRTNAPGEFGIGFPLPVSVDDEFRSAPDQLKAAIEILKIMSGAEPEPGKTAPQNAASFIEGLALLAANGRKPARSAFCDVRRVIQGALYETEPRMVWILLGSPDGLRQLFGIEGCSKETVNTFNSELEAAFAAVEELRGKRIVPLHARLPTLRAPRPQPRLPPPLPAGMEVHISPWILPENITPAPPPQEVPRVEMTEDEATALGEMIARYIPTAPSEPPADPEPPPAPSVEPPPASEPEEDSDGQEEELEADDGGDEGEGAPAPEPDLDEKPAGLSEIIPMPRPTFSILAVPEAETSVPRPRPLPAGTEKVPPRRVVTSVGGRQIQRCLACQEARCESDMEATEEAWQEHCRTHEACVICGFIFTATTDSRRAGHPDVPHFRCRKSGCGSVIFEKNSDRHDRRCGH